jgi:putative phosphonate metabolism protein
VRPDSRVAVYYTPDPGDALFAAGATWLGRDPESTAPAPQPELPAIGAITAEPRVYGFHATLKPPMRLATGCSWSDLVSAATALAGRLATFDLPTLAVADIHGFLALRETAPCAALQALADACVEQLDPFRASPSEAELTRRRNGRLSTAEEAMLTRWGYPYVFEAWFFHMTLTRRLSDAEKSMWRPAAEAYFAPALSLKRRVTDLCLFVQPAPGEDFVIAERLPLRG